MQAHSGIGQDPANDIGDIIRSITTAPVARKMTLYDVINDLSQPGSTTLTLPILGLDPLALSSGDETPADGVGTDGEQYMEASLKGTALFKQDRWVEELDIRETQTLAVLVGQAERGMSTMPNPENERGKIAPQYEKIRTGYEIKQMPDGRMQITAKMKLDIRLVEIQGGYHAERLKVAPIEAAVEQDVTTRVSDFFRKLQDYGLDSVNIGQRIKQQDPQLWREIEQEWPEIYPTVDFQVDPKAIVKTLGMVRDFLDLGE